MVERLAKRLIVSPERWLASRAADWLADEQQFDTVPVLMRYAVQGDYDCTQALVKLKIPQAAVGFMTLAEYDWASAARYYSWCIAGRTNR